jgi:hypothetical protein
MNLPMTMMTDIQPQRYRLLQDTALNWSGDVVWLTPGQVRDHHVLVTDEIPASSAETVRGADLPTTIERINDWPGTDASGEGTAIWHSDRLGAVADDSWTPGNA